MKQFVKDNLCLVVIVSIVVVVLLILGIWGITKLVSSDDKKLDNNSTNTETNQNNNSKPAMSGKYDSINDAKDLVDSATIEALYNGVLGIGYNSGGAGEFVYTSEIYQDKLVTMDDLSDEAILRAGVSQSVICGGEYESKNIPYSVIEEKIKQIFGKSLTIDSSVYVQMTLTAGYSCNKDECIPDEGAYCTNLPLTGNYELISVAANFNDANILYLYEENETNMYRHTFKKNDSKYYWYSTEPLGK